MQAQKEKQNMQIRIDAGALSVTARLDDTVTAQKIAAILPIEGRANRWGEEIYFEIPAEIPLDADAREEVPVGTLAYWPTGRAMCIFFGPTPVSVTDQPRAYSPVNVFGRIIEDATLLKQVQDGTIIKVYLIMTPAA